MSQPCFITGWWWLEPWWLFFMTGTRNSWDEWIIVVVHRFSWIFPETVGNVIIPTDFHSIIFFGVDRLKPPTRSTSSMVAGYVPCLIGRCRLIAVTARPGFHHWHHPMNQPWPGETAKHLPKSTRKTVIKSLWLQDGAKNIWYYCWFAVTGTIVFYMTFHILINVNHPNWRSHIFQRGWNDQPVLGLPHSYK